jgi:ubiquinone/menaquinone biosynthesis C-methylase UbiE
MTVEKSKLQESVAQHYNSDQTFDYESVRLTEQAPIEFAVTSRYLNKMIPDKAVVADVGVGTGHYAELLAKKGCNLYLVDLSQRLLEAAYTRLKNCNCDSQILETYNISATSLEPLKTKVCDAVLLLGPLYHLCSLKERQSAVAEVARILKPDGIIFAAGINRLAYFREQFRSHSQQVLSRQEFHQQFLKDGNADPINMPPLGYAHLTNSEDFSQIFSTSFEQISLIGVESFTAPFPTAGNELSTSELEAWVDLVEATGTTSEGLGMSDHFLYIGRRKQVGAQGLRPLSRNIHG